jgi:CubicO group peptidase (beta-lactamase class C family)
MKLAPIFAALLVLAAPLAADPAPATIMPQPADPYAAIDADFTRWMELNHVPGLVWGVVADGKLVHVKAIGVQAAGPTGAPVSAETGFRIASMSKAFTAYAILKLRDQGKLRLDDPAAKYIPELRRWANDITVADLLHHTAGFVTDDPWGDRQQPLPEAEFSRLLKIGVPRTAPRGTRFEYSNLGYAMLGRIVTNVSGMNFSRYVAREVFVPLGMTATTYENADVPAATRAIGYRWEDDSWREEPAMAHGAFGAMGGVTTTAQDYSRWIAYLLAAWPGDDQSGARATIRAMQYGGGLPQLRTRPGTLRRDCGLAAVYGAGLIAGQDCALGQVLYHGGGFPGYGSHMLLMPDAGVGVFALANRTYAGPSVPVWDAATKLAEAGLIKPRALPVGPALTASYDHVRQIWRQGAITGLASGTLAMNFTMDRDPAHWAALLAQRKAEAGECDLSATPIANGALSGKFNWVCTNGTIKGTVLLAPDYTPGIQSLAFEFTKR